MELIEILQERGDSEGIQELQGTITPETLAEALTIAAHAELQWFRKPQHSIRRLRKAVELVPDGSDANFLAWWAATDEFSPYRNSGEAVALAQIATTTEPNVPGFWNTLGVAQYRAGQFDESVDSLNKAAELRQGANSLDSFFLAMAHQQIRPCN